MLYSGRAAQSAHAVVTLRERWNRYRRSYGRKE
jgi:hypothetical protein